MSAFSGMLQKNADWKVLSDDGAMLSTRDFDTRLILASGKTVVGEHIYYTSDGVQSKTATTSQRAHGAGLGSFDNQILDSAALTQTTWAGLFRESSWRIPKLPTGGTTTSLWLGIIHSDRRGTDPNVGKRIRRPFTAARIEFVSEHQVIVTGRERTSKSTGSKSLRYTYTSLLINLTKQTETVRWSFSRSGIGGGLFDRTGVYYEDKNWRYWQAESRKEFALHRGKPDLVGGGLCFYVDLKGTTVYDAAARKESTMPDYRIALLSSNGRTACGSTPGVPRVVKAVKRP